MFEKTTQTCTICRGGMKFALQISPLPYYFMKSVKFAIVYYNFGNDQFNLYIHKQYYRYFGTNFSNKLLHIKNGNKISFSYIHYKIKYFISH